MNALAVIISSIVFYVAFIEAVPPEACFANFRWDDCGHPPEPVMYYWKPGSRCEVGIWRGCRPSPNMFKSEYECVSTCLFTVTPRPLDWHKLSQGEEVDDYDMDLESTTIDGESTTTDVDGSGSGDDGSASGGDASGSGDAGSGDAGSGAGEASGSDDAPAGDAAVDEEAAPDPDNPDDANRK